MSIAIRRFVSANVRMDDDGLLHGLAAPYYAGREGQEYELWSNTYERYMPGCFDQSVGQDDIRVLFNHDPSLILGRTRAETATVRSTDRGLEYSVKLADTSIGRDVREHASRGDISGSSCGWFVEEEEWVTDGERNIRNLHRLRLFDVSPVTFPAYEDTSVSTRDALQSYREWAKQNDWPGLALAELELEIFE